MLSPSEIQRAEDLVVEFELRVVVDLNFDAERFRARPHNFDRLRMAIVGDKKSFAIGSRGVMTQCHRFRGSGRFVEQRCVGDVELRKIDNHGLEIEQRFESPLREFGLIWRVSGIPTGIFENVPLNHRRRNGVGISRADEIFRNLIFQRQRMQFRQRFVLTFRLRQFQWPIQPDVSRHGGIDQGIQIFEAQFAQHLRNLFRIWADMTIGESGDRARRRNEGIRCRSFRRFRHRFFGRLRFAPMHCERLRSVMGASSEGACDAPTALKLPPSPAAEFRFICR